MPAGYALLAVGGYGRAQLYPALRRRRAGAAAGSDRRRRSLGHRALLRRAVGQRPRARACGAHDRRMRHRDGRRRHRAHEPPRASPPDRRAPLDAAVPPVVRGVARPAHVLRGQGARAAATPSQVPRRRVQPRAQRQGKPRRPARPADRAVDRARGRTRQQLARARTARAHDDDRGAGCRSPRTTDRRSARPAALSRRPARGPAGVRPAGRPRPPARPDGHADAARKRAVDAALLPRGQARAPGQHHPAAEHPRPPVPGGNGAGADRRRIPARRRAARHARRRPVREAALRDARRVPCAAAALGPDRDDRTHAAGAVAGATPDRRRVPARSRQPSALHPGIPRAARAHARAAADEPVRHPRAVPARVGPHRRADAARPLPRVHGGRAHPDGDPQPAPVYRGAACARASPVLAPHRGFRAQGGAVRRRPLPRHRQRPRRRPFHARRARCLPLLRAARHGEGRLRTGRMAGRASPHHVADCAEAGHHRSAHRRRLCAESGPRASARRAVSADRRRHPRYQSAGVERVEGQASRGPVPRNAPRAGR